MKFLIKNWMFFMAIATAFQADAMWSRFSTGVSRGVQSLPGYGRYFGGSSKAIQAPNSLGGQARNFSSLGGKAPTALGRLSQSQPQVSSGWGPWLSKYSRYFSAPVTAIAGMSTLASMPKTQGMQGQKQTPLFNVMKSMEGQRHLSFLETLANHEKAMLKKFDTTKYKAFMLDFNRNKINKIYESLVELDKKARDPEFLLSPYALEVIDSWMSTNQLKDRDNIFYKNDLKTELKELNPNDYREEYRSDVKDVRAHFSALDNILFVVDNIKNKIDRASQIKHDIDIMSAHEGAKNPKQYIKFYEDRVEKIRKSYEDGRMVAEYLTPEEFSRQKYPDLQDLQQATKSLEDKREMMNVIEAYYKLKK